MQGTKPKLLVIVGPTASGKSELAVKLAKKFHGEIISADSRQVYRGLNIGTGKIAGKWLTWKRSFQVFGNGVSKLFVYKKIRHYCIDFISPKKTYTVAEYKKCAEAAIKDITAKGKLPILAGGTGFWIDALVYDMALPEVPPDQKLRRRLEKKSAAELLKILQKLDPERAKTIEQKNPRRLIRAIEIAKTIGKTPELKKRSTYETLWIGIRIPVVELQKRIHRRTLRWIKTGLVKEGKRLKRQGLSWKRFYELGFDYKPLADFLRGNVNEKKMISDINRGLELYTLRQMTWWKRNKEIKWVKNDKEAERLTSHFLRST